jgi:hypothetical protein
MTKPCFLVQRRILTAFLRFLNLLIPPCVAIVDFPYHAKALVARLAIMVFVDLLSSM